LQIFEETSSLLKAVREEMIQLNVVSKQNSMKLKQQKELLIKKDKQRKEFISKISIIRQEMLMAPWLIMGEESGKFDMKFEDIRQQLSKMYHELEHEKTQWLPIKHEIETQSLKYNFLTNEENILNEIHKKKLKMQEKMKNKLC